MARHRRLAIGAIGLISLVISGCKAGDSVAEFFGRKAGHSASRDTANPKAKGTKEEAELDLGPLKARRRTAKKGTGAARKRGGSSAETPPTRLSKLRKPPVAGKGKSTLEAPKAPPKPSEPANGTGSAKKTPRPFPELIALRSQVWVYRAPNPRSRKLGYLRAGARIPIKTDKHPPKGRCKQGWVALQPEGYVCAGKGATTDSSHPIAKLLAAKSAQPNRSSGLPYLYGESRYPTPPLYVRLPTKAQERSREGKRPAQVRARSANFDDGWADGALVPDALANHQLLPSLSGPPRGRGLVSLGRAVPKSGFAILSIFDHEGRKFGLTPGLHVLPLDRLSPVRPSSFRGIQLGEFGLPLAFVRAHGRRFYNLDDKTGAITDGGAIVYRQAIPLTGKERKVGGNRYLQTRDGRWLRRQKRLVVLWKRRHFPGFAKPGKHWVDISILRQTLVAYEGKKAVYATLVSTGADGLGDPEETHSTVTGAFLVHTKHVSVTMDSDDEEDRFDLRDVPYVQYFHKGYALHAAYWHDDFGRPKSHGCVNLHPNDAAWLFGWTKPHVPIGWHGAMSLKQGSVVNIHP